MMKVVFHSSQAPQTVGTHSTAIRLGATVCLSGQSDNDPASGQLCEGCSAQTPQAFRNLRAVGQAGGGISPDSVHLAGFLTDMNCFAEFNQIMGEYLSRPDLARAVVQVGGLAGGGVVEAGAILVKLEI